MHCSDIGTIGQELDLQGLEDVNFSGPDGIESFRAALPCRYLVSLRACSRAAQAFIVSFPALWQARTRPNPREAAWGWEL